ncbi:MAG: tyrosine-type recombinase/integrase [Pyrinomonadaceae bacterium]
MAKRAKRDGIYKRKDRPGLWISWIDAQGRRRRRKTDAQSTFQAKSALSAELVRVEQAKVIGFAPPGEETFTAVAHRFLAHQKARLTTRAYEREKGIVEGHLRPFFTCKLSAIRRVDVQRYVTKRSGSVSAHSIQKELNVLKHLFNLAIEWEIIPFNPSQGVKSPKVPAGRVRYLQPTELRVLLDACHEWLQPIVALAVSTGMRRGEILSLRWLDVDLIHDRIMLPQTKNGEGRIVYLNKSAQAVIQSLPFDAGTRPTEKLFQGVTLDMVSVTFRRVCAAVGIVDFRFHDLRHTAASWLRMQGADIHTVAQLLGHKDLRMAARYQHLSPTFLADAVSKLDVVFGDLSGRINGQLVSTQQALLATANTVQ